MASEIYIHVGAGKTGTAGLQLFLWKNRDLFRSKGLEIPSVAANVARGRVVFHSLAAHRLEDRKALALWRKIVESRDRDVVVTSEFLHNKISAAGSKGFF